MQTYTWLDSHKARHIGGPAPNKDASGAEIEYEGGCPACNPPKHAAFYDRIGATAMPSPMTDSINPVSTWGLGGSMTSMPCPVTTTETLTNTYAGMPNLSGINTFSMSIPATTRNPQSARFHEILTELGALHDRKQQDYGQASDPFANVRSSQEWGIKPWVGALVRLNDKVKRLQKLAAKGELKNESAEDSMRDIAVYAIIGLVLYEQESIAAPENDTCPDPFNK